MSDDEHSGTQLLTAEYKDGQLEIVETPSYSTDDRDNQNASVVGSNTIMQVLDSGSKNMVVDLLNFTLVRGEGGEETYRLVSNGDADGGGSEATVTCVLANADDNDQESEEYVMVEGEDGPLVLLQSALQQTQPHKSAVNKTVVTQKTPITPAEILERAKALQKAKALMDSQRRSRLKPLKKPRCKNPLPPPHEMLASPNFKLFLYSCKMCSFKCNAIKDLSAHKAVEHWGSSGRRGGGGGGGGAGGGGRAAPGALQCARCPYRAPAHTQLMKHIQEKHVSSSSPARVQLSSAEVEAADVLVCGACGYESSERDAFRTHIEEEHGATTC